MEFQKIQPGKFAVNPPPDPYPHPQSDRDGDYDNQDKDYSKSSSYSSGDSDSLHARCDVDSSIFASHHTLGSGPNQAAPGFHVHDGVRTPKIGQGLGFVITGSRGGNAAVASIIAMLAKVIDFTDSTTP